MRLSEVVCLAATRLYTLSIEYKFTKEGKVSTLSPFVSMSLVGRKKLGITC